MDGRFNDRLELGGLQVMPRLSLEWRREYQTAGPEVTARFAGHEDASLRVGGPSPGGGIVAISY